MMRIGGLKMKKIDFSKFIHFDGAMGTMLQRAGLKGGDLPEALNITRPEIIVNIHKQYIAAGADIISTNTFGASRYKLERSGFSVEQVIDAAVKLGKKAAGDRALVALDLGPTGHLLAPLGDISFEEAYEAFAEQVKYGAAAGADLILIETMTDIYEARAAILAAKEHSDLPVFCTMTFEKNGRTLTGTDALTAVNILQALGVDALGINCSVGPKDMMPIINEILKYSKIPVMIQPNAGIPRLEAGETVFDVGPEEFSGYMKEITERGAVILGGCCGTTPEHIKAVKELLKGCEPVKREAENFTAVSSGSHTVFLRQGVKIIGERINPTGKKKFKEALKSNDMDYIINEAINQKEAGAHILDVNVGLPEIDEKNMMIAAVKSIQAVVNLPLQIDSMTPEVIEAAVRIYNGKPIINSVNGKEAVLEAILPIVKKYGTCVVALTLDDNGIPATAEERVKVAERIINRAKEYGIPKEDIIVDCLVLTASAQQKEVMETIKALRTVKERFGVAATLGVSNVSFGLPQRGLINRTFLAAALGAGLDTPILNPMDEEIIKVIDAFNVLDNTDREAKHFITRYGDLDKKEVVVATAAKPKDSARKVTHEESKLVNINEVADLKKIIIKGLKEEAQKVTKELLSSVEPLQVVDGYIIPALDEVGAQYETGAIFLPQLMQSAETVKVAFEVIKEKVKKEGGDSISKGKILMATVKGDVHDIGKNITKVLLENYGFDVVDMGKDVPWDDIVNKVKEENITLVGLSALMTTTVKSMEETIKALRKEGLTCKVMVGGAVLNQEYADMIGADYYAKDAQEGVKIAKAVFGVQ